MTAARLSMTAINDLQEVPRLAGQVEAFCRELNVPDKKAHRFNLALEEALTNVISHAFPDAARHQIGVVVEGQNNELIATVTDDGKPFDPLAQPAPDILAPIEDRKVGGLGIHLIRTLMDSVEHRRSNGRNELTFRMRF